MRIYLMTLQFIELTFMGVVGRGVFLTEGRKKSQFVCEYSGELISAEEGYRHEEHAGDSSVFRYFFSHKKEEL
jgi:hypothetical protein